MPYFTKDIDITLSDYEVEIELDVSDFLDEADINEVIEECVSRDSGAVIDAVIEDEQDTIIDRLMGDEDAVKLMREKYPVALGLGDAIEDEPLGERVRKVLEGVTPADVLRCMMLQSSVAVIVSTAVKLAFEDYKVEPSV